MRVRLAVLGFALLALGGCVTYPDITQSRSACRSDPGGWCGFVREAAVESYPYAIAATNAYRDEELFSDLGTRLTRLERLPITPDDTKKGFDYRLYALYPEGEIGGQDRAPVARIMAFRGTDLNSVTDLFFGTVRADQTRLARHYFEAERSRFADGLPWHVTGHSLGGALATAISIDYPEVRAWLFNLSPFYRGDSGINAANRMLINERGEVLRRFRRFRSDPAADLVVINCLPKDSTFTKHSVRKLADCLAWIAAYDSADALQVVRANAITKPDVECGPPDKPHPGRMVAPFPVCVHQSRPEQGAATASD